MSSRKRKFLERLTPEVMGPSHSFYSHDPENLSGNHALSVCLNLRRIKCLVVTSFVKSLSDAGEQSRSYVKNGTGQHQERVDDNGPRIAEYELFDRQLRVVGFRHGRWL